MDRGEKHNPHDVADRSGERLVVTDRSGGRFASSGADDAPPNSAQTLDARHTTPNGPHPPSSGPQRQPTSRRERAFSRWNAERLPIVDPSSYEVAGEFGKGGIGRVLRAHDLRLDRSVALKELIEKGGDAEERFVREALITARLQHPSIVPIHEAGRWPSGEPFYAMKLVSGTSLEDAINKAGALALRLALLPMILAVADAIAYAHDKRIIHRDIKPSNVLIGAFGEIVVIDWGLAKDLDEDTRISMVPGDLPPSALGEIGDALHRDRERAPGPYDGGLTMAGSILGTPAYMAPEQACGGQVDERADVYALGAILYHTLAGTPPYGEGSSHEVLRKLVLMPPPDLEERLRGVPEDLLAIVRKAMAREADGRYRTAKELADDLRRFQTGQIVGAHTYSRKLRLRRFVQKNRAVLAVAAVALAVLAVGGVAGMRGVIAERDRAERERDRAEHERDRAERGQSEADEAQQKAIERADALTLIQARALIDRDPNRALAWLKTLSPTFSRWPIARMIAGGAASRGVARVLRGHTASVHSIAFSPFGSALASASDDHTVRVFTLATGEIRHFSGHTAEVSSVSFLPGGDSLVTTSKDKTLRLWDLKSGSSRELRGHKDSVLPGAAIARDGSRIASRDASGEVRLWDVASGVSRVLSSAADTDEGVAFSPDGKTVAFTGGKTLTLWSIPMGSGRLYPGQEAPAEVIVYSPDGGRIATGDARGTVRLWDTSNGVVRSLPGHGDRVSCLLFSRDGKTLFSGSADRTLRVSNLRSGASRVFQGHEGGIYGMALSPDGRQIATGSIDKTVRLWDIEAGDSRALVGFEDGIFSVAFSPDGRTVAAGGADHYVRVWGTASPNPLLTEHEGSASRVAFLPDGARVASGGADGVLRVSPVRPDGDSIVVRGHSGEILDLSVSMDGARVATAGRDGTVRLADVTAAASRSQRALVLRGHAGEVSRVAFSPDGKLLASGGSDRTVRLWDAATGEGKEVLRVGASVDALRFSPDGKLLATGGDDKIVRVWTIATGASRALSGPKARVLSLAFSPDGGVLASGCLDSTISIWPLGDGEPRSIDAGGMGVSKLVFTPDGKSLLSMGEDSVVRIWDPAKSKLRTSLRGHNAVISDVAVSPDGLRAATAGLDRTVRLWDIASGEGRVVGEHAGEVVSVAFSPDGLSILSGGKEGTVRLWSDSVPTDPAAIRGWLDTVASERIDIRLLDVDREP